MTADHAGTERTERIGLDLMVVGAAKSATSSLIDLVHRAPRTAANPSGAEIGYFVDDAEYARGAAVARAKYLAPSAPDDLRVGKSAGLMYSRTALERLADDSPAVRAVALLRDPVARAYSAYHWAVRAGMETDSFPDAVEREFAGRDLDLPRPWLRRYLAGGEYSRHLDVVREVVGADQLDVLTMEDFSADAVGCVNRLLAPFGRAVTSAAPEGVHSNRASGVRSKRLARIMRNPALRAPLRRALPLRAQVALQRRALRLNERPMQAQPMDPATRARLVEHFAPWNARLEEQLGRELPWSRPAQGASNQDPATQDSATRDSSGQGRPSAR